MGSLPSGGQLTDSKIGHTLSLSNADGGDDDYCIKKKNKKIWDFFPEGGGVVGEISHSYFFD